MRELDASRDGQAPQSLCAFDFLLERFGSAVQRSA